MLVSLRDNRRVQKELFYSPAPRVKRPSETETNIRWKQPQKRGCLQLMSTLAKRPIVAEGSFYWPQAWWAAKWSFSPKLPVTLTVTKGCARQPQAPSSCQWMKHTIYLPNPPFPLPLQNCPCLAMPNSCLAGICRRTATTVSRTVDLLATGYQGAISSPSLPLSTVGWWESKRAW